MLVGSGQAAFAAQTDNFTITKFDAEYSLGRDSENRSTLRAKWTITANFPPKQNHGIAPVFVKEYDGHHTSFTLESVTDDKGKGLEYTWKGDELRIGNKDVYVEGDKTYVITYTQRDVTKHYADTGKDEFYWDAIGVEWRVPIANATVSLKLSDDLQVAKQTDLQCYMGAGGSNQRCYSVSGDNGVMTVQLQRLVPRNGVTVALGFASGTFAEYTMSSWEKFVAIWEKVQAAAATIAAIILVWLLSAYSRSVGRTKELGAIVPEYLPPKDASVTTSASLLRGFMGKANVVRGSVMTAQLLDLAVRHFIKIYEVKPKTTFRAAEYEIEVTKDVKQLKSEERELLSDMFNGTPSVGDKLNLKKLKNNNSYYSRTQDNDKKLDDLMDGEYALKEVDENHVKRFRRYTKWLGLLSVLLLSPVTILPLAVAFGMSFGKRLTDRGLALKRYLLGLKMYIGVAEEERLAMLQSPEGAEKVTAAGFDASGDEKKLIKLYERVLPYAVLFGQEKQWSKQIGHYYEQAGEQPDWYSGAGAFNAAAFASGMSSLNSAASSASSYSSSSGGSSGGGFAGGGGGGGGGGGW